MCTFWSRLRWYYHQITANKKSESWGHNISAYTPFVPVSATQGLQEAHGLHIIVPWSGDLGARSNPSKDSASMGYDESSDTPFVSENSPQGLQEMHCLHHKVPGPGAGSRPIKYSASSCGL